MLPKTNPINSNHVFRKYPEKVVLSGPVLTFRFTQKIALIVAALAVAASANPYKSLVLAKPGLATAQILQSPGYAKTITTTQPGALLLGSPVLSQQVLVSQPALIGKAPIGLGLGYNNLGLGYNKGYGLNNGLLLNNGLNNGLLLNNGLGLAGAVGPLGLGLNQGCIGCGLDGLGGAIYG